MPSLDEVIITADLARRRIRPPDHEGETRALRGLMDCLARSQLAYLSALLDADVVPAFAESGPNWTMVAPVMAVAERSRHRFETPGPVAVS